MKALTDGVYYIIILNVVVMLNDTVAYFGGVLFGKHKTGFPVSPNKSWEGYFSGLLFSVLSMVITNQVYRSFFGKGLFAMVEAVFLGIALSVLGNLGDLVESAVKRDGAIKDSGSIIPGHGGHVGRVRRADLHHAALLLLPGAERSCLIRSGRMSRTISILGSTGSIGVSTLRVLALSQG